MRPAASAASITAFAAALSGAVRACAAGTCSSSRWFLAWSTRCMNARAASSGVSWVGTWAAANSARALAAEVSPSQLVSTAGRGLRAAMVFSTASAAPVESDTAVGQLITSTASAPGSASTASRLAV